ncbi:MAG: hypothetical protein IPL40_01685 [Proteobacteria bacterium]|nr:hypothetical protein [Pseudomonadota bacterium]
MQGKRPRIDISTLCGEGKRSTAEQRLLHFASRIVAIGNLLPADERLGSTVPCRCRPHGRPCRGRLEVERPPQADRVRWICPACADEGEVTGWRGTRWDLSAALRSGRVVSLFAARSRVGGRCARETARVVRLDAELVGGPVRMLEPVRRQLCLPLDASLHSLHALLRGAFAWQDDGPYEFLFGAPYEPGSQRFTGWQRDPSADNAASSVSETELIALDSLALRVGQVFGYLFDFADEWVHRLEVLALEDVPLTDARARVAKRAGKAPPQHADGRPSALPELASGTLEASPALDGRWSYDPECPLPPHQWLALDPAEQVLRVLSAHRASACSDQESTLLFHAALHCLAETSLAQGDRGSRAVLRRESARGGSRHEVIHHLGEVLAARQLGQTEPEAEPAHARPAAQPKLRRARPLPSQPEQQEQE